MRNGGELTIIQFTLSRLSKNDLPQPEQPIVADEAGESGASSAAAVVLGYVESRVQEQKDAPSELSAVLSELLPKIQALQAKVKELEATGAETAKLRRTIEVLKIENEALRETVKRLEIGFRRHVSERVSPDQLKLVLGGNATATGTEPGTPVPEGETASGSSDAASSPSDPPSAPAKKNRHEHGRRRIGFIPQVIIEMLPAEVMLKGLENFRRMGEEDCSMLGYRRGGPIEVVMRRPKFVPRDSCTETIEDSGDAPSEASTPAPVSIPQGAATPVLVEHEIAMVPDDTGFKSNPFVDGAIVRYTPDLEVQADPSCAVFIAPTPECPLPKSLADASLLAHLLVGKLDYHMPYYRQEIEAARNGYPISRTNMARWQYECGSLAMPIFDAMWQEALARSWFAMDATGTAIHAKEQYRYGHVFVLVAPGDSVLFAFTPKYDSETVKALFGGCSATILADASANHNVLFGPGKSREAACWAHARKPFVKALRGGEGRDAAYALQIIQGLFHIEEKIALLSPKSRLEVRQTESAPLVKNLFEWADKRHPEVKNDDTFVRIGLGYLLNQREALHEFLRNGEIPIHNNISERALRRIVKGRMNWQRHGSDDHAKRACAISSLIASCELHGLDPELYLQEVLTVVPSWPVKRALELSPKNWVGTRQRLIAEGRLKYIDIAQITGSKLALRAR